MWGFSGSGVLPPVTSSGGGLEDSRPVDASALRGKPVSTASPHSPSGLIGQPLDNIGIRTGNKTYADKQSAFARLSARL